MGWGREGKGTDRQKIAPCVGGGGGGGDGKGRERTEKI